MSAQVSIDGKIVVPAALLPPRFIAHARVNLPEVVEHFDDEAWQMWDEAVSAQDLREWEPSLR